jgi:predicted amidophosphoribosyltransferase
MLANLKEAKRIPIGVKYCPKCGKKWPSDKAPNFCSDCGLRPNGTKGYELTYEDGSKEIFFITFREPVKG